jgi:hypothetical protein
LRPWNQQIVTKKERVQILTTLILSPVDPGVLIFQIDLTPTDSLTSPKLELPAFFL